MIASPHMASNHSHNVETGWLRIGGAADPQLEQILATSVRSWVESGMMPPNEAERVARVSTAIASRRFTTSPERLEMLRSLCQIYSAGIRAGKISSHRRFVGPVIVACKKVLFRAIAALLGPSFERQREFNAGVIRLLGHLCNEDYPSRNQ